MLISLVYIHLPCNSPITLNHYNICHVVCIGSESSKQKGQDKNSQQGNPTYGARVKSVLQVLALIGAAFFLAKGTVDDLVKIGFDDYNEWARQEGQPIRVDTTSLYCTFLVFVPFFYLSSFFN